MAVWGARRGAWLLALLVLTAFLVVAIREVAWAEAATAWREARWSWLLVAVVGNFLILPLGALQWIRFLPRDRSVARADMFWIISVTSTVANTGPFLTGHAAGVHLLATRGGLGYAGAVSVKVLDQVTTGLVKLTLVGVCMLLVPLPPAWRAVALTLLLGVPVLVAGAYFAAVRGRRFERWAERDTEGRSVVWSKGLGFVGRAARQLDAIRRPPDMWRGILLGFLRRGAEGLAIWAVIHATGLAVPVWGFLLVLTAVNLSTMASITPANLGIYEGSAILAYGVLGVDLDVAVGVSVLQHLTYLLPLAGTGWLLLGLDRLTLPFSG